MKSIEIAVHDIELLMVHDNSVMAYHLAETRYSIVHRHCNETIITHLDRTS
jgi:hypothetical protein